MENAKKESRKVIENRKFKIGIWKENEKLKIAKIYKIVVSYYFWRTPNIHQKDQFTKA